MKRVLLPAIICFFFTIEVNAQFYAKSADDGYIWILKDKTTLLRSMDKGVTWTTIDTKTTGTVIRFCFFDALNGYIITLSGNSYLLYFSSDAGTTWQHREWNPSHSLLCVTFLNKDIVIAGTKDLNTSKFNLIRSSDGGKNWDTTFIRQLSSINPWDNPAWTTMQLYHTSGGNIYISLINFGEQHTGIEDKTDVLFSTDYGITWNSFINITKRFELYFVNKNIFYEYFGSDARPLMPPFEIQLTTDGGSTFNKVYSSEIPTALVNVISKNSFIIWNSSDYLITTDCGITWNKFHFPFELSKSIFMLDETYGIAIDLNCRNIKRTTDGCKTWGEAVGTEEPESSGIPSSFTLKQNYPNPFNPSTIIKYSIPAVAFPQHVTLIIYDLLGREITTLVNEEKLPGEYSVPFNSARIPSGVYFYTLTTGNKSLTRKMVLMK
jgi:photosystem II stability/assembly factor-like uncharacterized protein